MLVRGESEDATLVMLVVIVDDHRADADQRDSGYSRFMFNFRIACQSSSVTARSRLQYRPQTGTVYGLEV